LTLACVSWLFTAITQPSIMFYGSRRSTHLSTDKPQSKHTRQFSGHIKTQKHLDTSQGDYLSMKDIIDGTRCFCFLIPENYTSR
jgi:hypothetical protein